MLIRYSALTGYSASGLFGFVMLAERMHKFASSLSDLGNRSEKFTATEQILSTLQRQYQDIDQKRRRNMRRAVEFTADYS